MDCRDPGDAQRRRWLVQALAGGLFGTALGGRDAFAVDGLGGRPDKLPPGQSIYRISGKVLVNGAAASAPTRIAASDMIETASGAELVFVVDNHAMIVRGDSRIALQASGNATALAGVQVAKGRVLSVFAPGAARRITTPTAVVLIRGTGLYIEADAAQTYFCTCYGATDVVAVGDPQSRESVIATHHDKPLFIVAGEQAGRNIRPAPFINHTDQELMLIETLVGRVPPFTFPGTQYNAPRPTGGYRR